MANSENKNSDLVIYEMAFLILPSIAEDKLSDVVDSMRKVITKAGGDEIDAEMPAKQNLAYQMSKTIGARRYVVSDAYIGWIKFEIAPENISVVKSGMEKMEEILRFLIVKAQRETVFTFAKAREKMQETEEVELVENNGKSEELAAPVIEE